VICCVDVDYRPRAVVAACVGLPSWTEAASSFERAAQVATTPAPYVPGSFYLRELPALLAILDLAPTPLVVVIDGYVTLAPGRAGLGEHLHRALGGRVIVVGVAKTPFRGATHAATVRRGHSKKPVFVTAVGMSVEAAASAVRAMHGPHRIPTWIARADRLARDFRV
jgi:deoxyribonuclease V